MDIRGAQAHINKLLSYVQDISDSNKHVYSKSRYKLKEISDTCEYVVDIISDILKDQMFEESDDEFAGLDNDNLDEVVNHAKQKFKSIPNLSNISSQDKRKAIALYSEVLKQVANQTKNPIHVYNCAKMIWEWFNYRFQKSRKTCPKFHYNITQIPLWIRNIVLWYGNNITIGNEIEAMNSFDTWCHSLVSDSDPSKYPLPYEIYNVSSLDENYSNLVSVVMWDILLDSGYIRLCNKEPIELYLKEDSVYKYCGAVQPEILDNYAYYKQNSNILVECGLDR